MHQPGLPALFIVYNNHAIDPDFLVLFFKIITDERCSFGTESDQLAVKELIESDLDSLSPSSFRNLNFL